MTEENQRKLYEHFLATGQTEKAEEIIAIPRYSKFAKLTSTEEPVKKKKEK